MHVTIECVIRFFEGNFGVLLIIAFAFGLFLPGFGKNLNSLVIPTLMLVLFFTYLKVDYVDIISHIKQPKFLMYVLVMYLLVIPTIVYFIAQFINPELALALLLLSAMPPGVTSSFMTEQLKGNVSLSVTVGLVAYIAAPFSAALLMYLLTQQSISVDVWALSRTLILISFVPLILSQVVRKLFLPKLTQVIKYSSTFNVIILIIMVYIIVAVQADDILAQSPLNLFFDTLSMYLLFIFLFISGYLIAFWRRKQDKVALGTSKAFMNNVMALGLAFSFFDERIIMLIVLSEIPWNTMFLPFQVLINKLK